MSHPANPVGFFVRHKVAANLVMLVMLMIGVLGLMRMNIQFLPDLCAGFRHRAGGLGAAQQQRISNRPSRSRWNNACVAWKG